MNLLSIPWIRATLRSRFYPAAFQWTTAATFVLVLVTALFGTNNAGQNFGMALAWTVWWPLLPLSFVFAGRFWCAVCPLAWLSDQVQRAVGVRFSAPRVLVRYGPWIMAGLFIMITYLDQTWGFDGDARKTGYLLLALLWVAIFFGAFFERRTFCRHACFVGAFASNYSRAGMVELRAEPGRCRDCRTWDCSRGTASMPGCPVFLSAPAVEDSGTCHLCGNCVKNCPHDAIRISLRAPTVELWNVRQPRLPDVVLVTMVMGMVLIEQATALRLWNPLVEQTGALLHLDPYASYPLIHGFLLAVFMLAPLAGLVVASLVSTALDDRVSPAIVFQNSLAFGYAMIPLALASHAALGLHRLLGWSRGIPFAFLAMVGRFPAGNHAAWLPNPAVCRIEMVVLASGIAGSWYCAWRIAKRHARRRPWAAWLPHAWLLLGLLAANLYAVSQL
ncbi:MAG: 4Fe-4S binding protein [Bryobacteraceae bacterium]|jgi:NAD-dependent dihydropyrimidine dehydrogenase PreA subunit